MPKLSTADLAKMEQEYKNSHPCTFCNFAKTCENKNCPRWRKWFEAQWKKFNNYYEKHKPEVQE